MSATSTPNKNNIRRWVEALRSGEYKQGKHALHPKDTFCCLGVACDISGLGSWTDGAYDHKGGICGSNSTLPYFVRDWLGIDSVNPELQFPRSYLTASEANDDKRRSFDDIASAIERTFLSEEP